MVHSLTKSPDFFIINSFQPLGTFYSQNLCLVPPYTPSLQHDTTSSHLFDLPLNVYSHLWPSLWHIQNARTCQHSVLGTQRKPTGSRYETFEVLTAVCCDVRLSHCWTLKIEALESFEMSRTIVPTSQHKFPEDLNLLEADICIWRGFPYSPKFRIYWVCFAPLPIRNKKSLLFAVTWCTFICTTPIAVNVSCVLGKLFDNFKNYTRILHQCR